ncbi:MAG: radical SAM protein [Alphaproteobacteria bacterium]|nr:radical SAM protein [Alphaproteobacteria bacterium]
MEFRACSQPWFEMQITHESQARFCCYLPKGMSVGGSIRDMWNSDYFRETRALIASGRADGSDCDGCGYVAHNAVPMFTNIPDGLTSERRNNWRAAMANHAAGVTIVDNLPVKYYLQFGLSCNLRCKMCDHPTRFIDGDRRGLSPDLVFEDTALIRNASELHIIGGEPFLIPDATRFIDRLSANADARGLMVDIYTNAYLLNRFIDRLAGFENLVLTVSLDSFGESYEAIRRRSSWRRVADNLLAFKAHAEKRGLTQWKVHVACVLMRSGLPELDRLVAWCAEHDFSIHFVPVINLTDEAREERIVPDSDLVARLPEWEEIFCNSVEILRRKGWWAAADQLAFFHQQARSQALTPLGRLT